MMKKYDVVVAGGGTAGCACAYTAAKLGMKVLIVEKKSYLGGSITSSLVIPAMKTSDNAINTDFFNTLYENLYNINGAITYCDGNKGWFNPELTKIILDRMMLDAGVDIEFESNITNIVKQNANNLSLYNVTIQCDNTSELLHKLLSHSIETIYIVDATGDAKICELLNFEFLENNNNFQPISLRFIMSGVDSKKFSNWLVKFDKNRDVTTCCKSNGAYYYSTAYTWDDNVPWALKPLFKKAIADGVITEQDSNYFQIFSVAGTHDSVAFNTPRILEQPDSKSLAYIKARESILRISNFCKKYLPGFENAYISSIADSIGVRVSKRVKGKYVYTENDLKSGKQFETPVVISNYPIDIHSDKKNCSKLEKVFKEYQLPIESLIVDDNLFVIGRCISADFESQAALRIIPSCFSMGEGLAKYLANKINLNHN